MFGLIKKIRRGAQVDKKIISLLGKEEGLNLVKILHQNYDDMTREFKSIGVPQDQDYADFAENYINDYIF